MPTWTYERKREREEEKKYKEMHYRRNLSGCKCNYIIAIYVTIIC